jgi:hypothetical protein
VPGLSVKVLTLPVRPIPIAPLYTCAAPHFPLLEQAVLLLVSAVGGSLRDSVYATFTESG